jgi:outer membrane protein TolC
MKRFYFLLSLSLLSIVTSAQVTLEECQKLARENYPLIKQYDLIAQTTAYSVSNAKRTWLPQVSLTAQATYQSDVMAYPDKMIALFTQMGYDMKGLNKDQYKFALEVNQTIWDGGQSSAQKQVAESEGNVSRQNLEVEMYALRDRVNALYFGILMLDEQMNQNLLVQQLLESNSKKLEGLINNGVAMPADRDVMMVEILSNQQKYTQIETTREAYCKMLILFTGRNSLLQEKLVKPVPQMSASPEIKRMELKLFEAQKMGLAAQKSTIYSSLNPRLGAFAQGFYGNPGLNLFQDMLENTWTWNYMVGLKLQWNFGGHYTKHNNIQKIENAQKQLDVRRETFLFNTSLQMTQQQAAIEKMRKLMVDDDKIIALRTSIRKVAEQKLANGVLDINDLLREINAENLARVGRAAHEIEMLNKLYDFKNTVNE